MLFVMILKWRSGLSKEQRDQALVRRAQWNYPESVKLIAEYWPSSDDASVLSIFETTEQGAMLEIGLTWGDMFEIRVSPAITAEEGLTLGAQLLGGSSA